MSGILNLAGIGVVFWKGDENCARVYKSVRLPFYDDNLHNIALFEKTNSLVAHIRGTPLNKYQSISYENLHPFFLNEAGYYFSHNGDLIKFMHYRKELVKYINPEIFGALRGDSDSQWIFGIFASQLKNPYTMPSRSETIEALAKTLEILDFERTKAKANISSPINFVINTKHYIIATRLSLDSGLIQEGEDYGLGLPHSLWYTFGKKYVMFDNLMQMEPSLQIESLIVSSEPLTSDITTWIEIPRFSLMQAYRESTDSIINLKIEDISSIYR